MGLDTIIQRKNDGEEIAYWRKCYGIDRWLRSKAIPQDNENYEFKINTEVLKQPFEKMTNYIQKLIGRASELGYYVQDTEELKELIINLDEGGAEEIGDLDKLEKIIMSFASNGLDYSAFKDSIWSPLHTFLTTYAQFEKALNTEEEVTLISSY